MVKLPPVIVVAFKLSANTCAVPLNTMAWDGLLPKSNTSGPEEVVAVKAKVTLSARIVPTAAPNAVGLAVYANPVAVAAPLVESCGTATSAEDVPPVLAADLLINNTGVVIA